MDGEPLSFQTLDGEPLSFQTGETQTQISGRTSPQLLKRYLVRAAKGQVIAVEPVTGDVTFNIRYPDGEPVEDASGLLSWQAQLPTAGDYQIEVIAPQETAFTLNVSLRN